MRKFSEFTDTQLVISFQEGNCDALEALITRYKEKLFSSILFIVKDKYLAEDLFQETFVRIIDTLRSKRYNEEGKFLPWAMRIAHNLCVDYFRKAIEVDPEYAPVHEANLRSRAPGVMTPVPYRGLNLVPAPASQSGTPSRRTGED